MFELLPIVFVATLSFGLWELKSERWRFVGLMSVFALAMGIFLVSLQPAVWVFSSPWVAFACWEVMGFCSFQLIAQKEKDGPEISQNAMRAFFLTKLGDLGFLAAILLGFDHPASFSLLAFAALAKSAQWPLHSWLVGAMVGPSAASALIHSATMVAAGVVLLSQAGSPPSWFVSLTAFSSLWAALWSVRQNELKKILAYSTIAQLGVMYFVLPASNTYLVAHGFYKAPLFLLAAIVLKTQKLGRFGFLALVLVLLSQLGLPFSKMSLAKADALQGISQNQGLQIIFYGVLFLNAWASARFAKLALKNGVEKSFRWIELLPLLVVLGGLTGEFYFSASLSFLLGIVGFVLGAYFFKEGSPSWGDPFAALWNFLGKALVMSSKKLVFLENKIFDFGGDQVGLVVKRFARFPQIVDDVFLNNVLIRVVLGYSSLSISWLLRRLHVGLSQTYVLMIVLSFFILLYWIGVNH